MNLTIDTLTDRDWRAFRDVRLAALRDAPEAFWASYADEAAHGQQQWESFLDAATWLVARSGEDKVGLAGLLRRPELSDEPELIGMWVRPDVRRRGIAGRLVADALRSATAQHARAVTLWVLESNPDAARLYARLGFAYTGENMALPRDPNERELRMRMVVTGAASPQASTPAPAVKSAPAGRWRATL